jgi:hypothetical protein
MVWTEIPWLEVMFNFIVAILRGEARLQKRPIVVVCASDASNVHEC